MNIVKNTLQDYKVVFDNFKDTSFVQISFLFFFTVRFYVFTAIIAYLFHHPLAQTILLNLLGIAILLYLVVKRPFKSHVELVKYVVQESIMEVVNICVFILAIMDTKDEEENGRVWEEDDEDDITAEFE